MERRSDKYAQGEKHTRVKKNEHLYDELNSKIGYEEITDIDTETEVDLSSLNLHKPKREDYQKIKEYKDMWLESDKKEKQGIKEENKPKTFDINLVLEEAKKNRVIDDELEKKRKLNGEEYNVLSNLNKKYLNNDDLKEDDSDDLKELINTIASKTLVSDDEEKELLSELLATTIDIKLESELSKDDINKLYELNDDEKDTNKETDDGEKMDNSFYTHSIELSKKDLLRDDEVDTDEEPSNKLKISFLVIIILVVLLMIAYFVLKHFGIAFN